MHKIEGAHCQCVNNHYAKFEYKGMELLELEITQTRHPLSISDERKCLRSQRNVCWLKMAYFTHYFMFCAKMIPLDFRSLNLKTKLNPEAHEKSC